MANFPRPEDVRIPGIETAPVRQIDTSYTEIAQGAQQLAAGVGRAGAGIASYALQEKRQENTVDLSAAEAEWTKQKIAIKNAYQDRTDYEDFPDEAKAAIEEAKASAAALIRDDKMRASWVGDKAPDAMVFGDGFTDMAHGLKKADDTVRFETSIGTNAELIADPTVPDEVRNRARADVTGSLIRAIDTGLITREQGKLYRDKYLDGAEETLAINRGMIELQVNPAKVMAETGITSALGGTDVSGAVLDATGNKLTLTPELGAMVAKELGDNAFPSDPALREAYLKDPEIQKRYTAKALDALTTKFQGDMTAAVVALSPDGGEADANAWIASGHDEGVLSPATRKFLRDTMGAIKAPADAIHLPVEAAPGIEMDNIDAGLLDRWEKTQGQFGAALTIIGGKRSNLAAGMDGITVDTSKLSDEDKVRLIETASAMGFSGIGVSDDALHLDFGNKRAMGVDGGDVIPGWAKDVMGKHANGDITEIPVAMANVDPKYAKLSFDQRMKLYDEAKQQQDRINVEGRAAIEIAADNAPAALLTQGKYDGFMPTAADFVKAYGAADGIDKFKSFQLQVDVANTAYGMRTMPMGDIANMLEDKKPTSTGDMAGYENKRYNALIEAAANVKEAREKDPAGYTASVFPAVQDAMEHFGENPDATKTAISVMAAAQTKLGIEKQVLLPKAIEDKVTSAWKDKTLSADQRFAPLISAVMASNDDGQREAILKQMQDGGVPTFTTAIMRAMTRPDGQSSAGFLMRAATIDPKDIPDNPAHKTSEVHETVGALYGEGGVAQVYYGLNGTFHDKNLTTAMDEASLLETDARLLMIDKPSLSLDQAVAEAAKHMFGDIKVAAQAGGATRAGMQITIPSGEDPQEYSYGLTALLPKVATALKVTSDPVLGGITDRSLLALSTFVRDNDMKMTLRNGYFANAGKDAYQFLDEDGVPVVDTKGKPLTFTAEEVKAASKSFTGGRGDVVYDPAAGAYLPNLGQFQ